MQVPANLLGRFEPRGKLVVHETPLTENSGARFCLDALNWENEARRIVRAELVRRGLTYQRLAARLQANGIPETERSIASKMSRGTFSFVFFLQCMHAVGQTKVSFEIHSKTPPPAESDYPNS